MEKTVDFLERIFHIAPDGDSGFLECAILLSLLLTAVGFLRFGGMREVSAGRGGIQDKS